MEDVNTIPYGYCQCGCGVKTTIATKNYSKKGMVKGEPVKYLSGHWIRNRFGAKAMRWNGGRIIDRDGYVMIKTPHPRNTRNGYVYEHVIVMEKTIGKLLPEGSVVHHINGNKTDNHPSNLQLFESHSMHMKSHRDQEALNACGNPDFRRCYLCHGYDSLDNLKHKKNSGSYYHKKCAAEYQKKRRSS